MATTALDAVIHYKKKLDKNPNNDVVLSVIHKLSKIPVTAEILQATHIGKCIRKLSKRDDAVGNQAKIVLKKWRDVFANVVPDKKSKSDSSNHKEISRQDKSLHKNASEKSSKKHVVETSRVKVNNSTEIGRSRYNFEVKKETHSKYKDYDPLADDSQGYDPECPELFPSSSETTKKKAPVLDTYEPSLKRKHSMTSDENGNKAGIKLPSKKSKHANDSTSNLDSFSKIKSSEKQDKQSSHKVKLESHASNSHSMTVSGKKMTPSGVKSDKDRGSKPKSSSDPKKDTESAESSGGKSKKLKPIKKELLHNSEEFNSSNVTFEDCLGFNDVVNLKKKKSSPTKPLTAPSRLSSTMKSPINDSKKHVKKDKSPAPKVKVRKESSHKEKRTKEPPVSPKRKPEPAVASTSALPEVQPNYRPLPRNLDLYSHKKKETLSNEEAIMFISSRKEKTAVYSGRKNFYLTEVPSLVDCCIKFLIDNIDALEYVGTIPYIYLKPVLEKCTPTQLMNIENFNPSLIDETNELWEIHCKKNYKLLSPLDHETWRDLYLRASDEREKKLKSITANISANISKSNPGRQLKLAYVDMDVKPPRDVARRQAKYGTALPASVPSKTEPSSGSVAKSTPKIMTPPKVMTPPKPTAPVINSASSSSGSSVERPFPPKKPKVAPLMAKTLKSLKQCYRRK